MPNPASADALGYYGSQRGKGRVSDNRNRETFVAEVSGLLAEGRVVPVVGSGVSTATAEIPGWWGAIRNGLNHVEEVKTCQEEELRAARNLLHADDPVQAAQRLGELLGRPHGEFPFWLKTEFGKGREDVRDRRLVEAITDLLAPVVVTTNYDRLLSRLHYDAPDVATWRQPALMQRALREGHAVMHLHGVYDDPESVVLGVDDYEGLVADDSYRAVLQALWLDRTLLFVGCSFDGLKDPDLSRLLTWVLTWASETFAGTAYKHYALLRTGTFTHEDVARFLHDWRIQAVGYGPGHEDLPGWL